MKRLFLFLSCLLSFVAHGQLQPFIGVNSEPSSNEPICTIPWYLGSFYTSGLSEGSYAHDFKLYGVNGDSLHLAEKLANGKPVLLIAGSLTCPVFMAKLATINQVVSTYGNQLQVYIIYTLEAHPTDTSVYFGYVNVGSQNTNAGILFPQPITYGQRKHMVDTMSYWGTAQAPVFIDGPCNPWWTTFGPAPNNAYLIDTTGKIVAKHGWFHKNPDNIFCDIDSLLGMNSGLCSVATNGSFHLHVLNQSVAGAPFSILYDYAQLINTSNATVEIGIKKLQSNLPSGWQTAFCADVCYSPNDDSITIQIPAQDTMLFSLDFITDATSDTGSVKVGFRNTQNMSNMYQTTFRAATFPLANSSLEKEAGFTCYPNPTPDLLYIQTPNNFLSLQLFNLEGRLIKSFSPIENILNLKELASGMYLLKARTKSQVLQQKIIRF